MAKQKLDLGSIRRRLQTARGRQYWRSLQELAETEDFRQFLENEFPPEAVLWGEPVNRRRALSLLGASLGLAGVTGCTRQPTERIVPYIEQPEQIVPGKPLFFATALAFRG